MSAAMVRGWCPSLHEPMAALDGLIVRVKPFVRGLSAADLQVIAEAAERAGAGGLELTGRGALQVRGLNDAGAATFARAMVEAGLASADAAAERRRNVQLGVGCGPELLSVAGALESWLEEDASLSALPAKFGFAVSPVGGMSADIVVMGEDAGCIIISGEVAIGISGRPLLPSSSGLSRGSSSPEQLRLTALKRRGTERSALGTSPEGNGNGGGWGEGAVLDAVQSLTRAFLTLAPRLPAPPRRMKGLIQAIGPAAVLAEAGLQRAHIAAVPLRLGPSGPLPPFGRTPPSLRDRGDESPPTPILPTRSVGRGTTEGGGGAARMRGTLQPQQPSTDEAVTDAAVLMRRPTIGPNPNGYGLGVVFGVLNASAVRTAAELATRYGDGRVLLAPGRIIWLSGAPSSTKAQLAAAASAAGFIVDPHDRRLRLDACVGAAGCARASEDVRAAALRLASAAPATGLHVSGCAKGCAHPTAAGATLVSRGAPGRYDLILDGAPSAPPTRTDVTLDEIAEHLSEPAL